MRILGRPGRGAARLGVVAASVVVLVVAVTPGVGVAAGGTNLLRNGTFEGTGSGSLAYWSGLNANLALARSRLAYVTLGRS